MAAINKNKLLNLMNAGAEERYYYFIRKVADFEKVWGLYKKDGWALSADAESRQAITFWPEEAFAEVCASGSWQGYKPRAIKLVDFVDKWLPGIKKDKMVVAIFPTIQDKSIFVSADKIAQDLDKELDDYI